jgi:predicted CXXCH cytochrome family protein
MIRLAFLMILFFTGNAFAGTPKPVLEPARGESCVAEPERMRREHAAMLRHEREAGMRQGERGKASLRECVECHASRETGSVAARREDFCVSCHAYVAVKLDCFECHTPKATRRR